MKSISPTIRATAIDEAHRLIISEGLSANKAATRVAEPIGVTARTVQRWAFESHRPLGEKAHDTAKEARAVADAEYQVRRGALRGTLLTFAEEMIDKARRTPKALDARNWAWCAAVMVDKVRLEEGKATGRIESVPIDEATRVMREWVESVEADANAG